jgi:hypothetical protein
LGSTSSIDKSVLSGVCCAIAVSLSFITAEATQSAAIICQRRNAALFIIVSFGLTAARNL